MSQGQVLKCLSNFSCIQTYFSSFFPIFPLFSYFSSFFLFFLFSFKLIFPLVFVFSVNCSVGWIENGSSCYYVYNDTEQRLTFWEAKRWCKQQGHSCQLTSVLSQEENDFLDYLINETHLPPNETFYIGLKKNNNQGKWRWIDDQPYNYTNWFQGQEPPPESKGNCAFYKGDVHQWGQELKCSKTERLSICKQQKHSGIFINLVNLQTQ